MSARASRGQRALAAGGLGPKTFVLRWTLGAVARLRWLWRVCGADPRQVRDLCAVRFALDERRGKARVEGGAAASPLQGGMLMLLVFNLLGGGAIGLATLLEDPYWAIGLPQCFVMAMAGMVLVTDYSAVFLDDTDVELLGPLPVEGRTHIVARIAHVTAYLGLIVGSVALPGLVIGCFARDPITFAPVWIVASSLSALLALGLGFGAFVIAARLLSPERFESASVVLQMLATAGFFGFFQILPPLIGRDAVRSFTAGWPSFGWFVPSFHQGGLLALVEGEGGMRPWILTGMALLLPLVVFAGMVRLGSIGFLAALAARYAGARPDSTDGWDLPVAVGGGTRFRAGRDFGAAMTARDRTFRQRAWPQMAIVIVVGIGLVLRQKDVESANGFATLVYLCGAASPAILLMTRYSDDCEARWLFQVAPVADYAEFVQGAWRSLLRRLVVPLLFVGAVVVGVFGGLAGLVHGLFAAGAMLLVVSGFARSFVKVVPFTRRPVKTDPDSIGLGLVALLFAGVAGGAHWALAIFVPLAIPILLPVVWALAIMSVRRRPPMATPIGPE